MPEFILRMEGVDFGATVMDTHNLSAFRGGSLALLAAPKAVREFLDAAVIETIFEGASQGAWVVKADDPAAAKKLCDRVRTRLKEGGAKETAEAVYPHLSFVVDVAEGSDYGALIRVEAKNRARQFLCANWTPPDFEPLASGLSRQARPNASRAARLFHRRSKGFGRQPRVPFVQSKIRFRQGTAASLLS
ncbi:MAG: hypothetical protein HYS63_01365 [Methylocystis sp.]|nr:hypothetical protein [Methylocystis sp.]